jgi:hypothetical protein
MALVLTAMGDASSLASVAVAGREPRAAADVVVKDVEAWSPFYTASQGADFTSRLSPAASRVSTHCSGRFNLKLKSRYLYATFRPFFFRHSAQKRVIR